MRLVSLACSNTEIVCALGCASMLVGVDDHSDHPAEVVSRLPRVGPDLQIDLQRVVGLAPDLVLASRTVPGHEAVVEGLERAGLPYLAPEPTRLEDVYQDILLLADRLGVPPRGERLVAEMRAELRPVQVCRPPAVLVEWWPRPVIVPGRRSWVTDLLELAGAVNPLGGEEVKSRPVTDAEVRAFDPEAVVISWCGVPPAKYRPDVVASRKAWQGIRAVRGGHIYPIPEAYLGRPGPRLVEGYRLLRRIVEELR